MSIEKRRFPRYIIALPVRLKHGRTAVDLVTADVSRHGAFIRTDSPKGSRQLVQLTFRLPSAQIVDVMGMVARAVRPEDKAVSGPGMGIDFFALSARAKDYWNEFVFHLREEARWAEERAAAGEAAGDEDRDEDEPGKGAAEPTGTGLAGTGLLVDQDFEQIPEVSDIFEEVPAEASIPEGREDEIPPPLSPDDHAAAPSAPTRRRAPRYAASFLVRLKDKTRLKKFYTKDISTGGMFLKTPLLKKVGDEVEVILVHPETDQEFQLAGTVVRVVATVSEASQGMGIKFHELDEEQQQALIEFIETGLDVLEPRLAPEEQQIVDLRSAVSVAPDSPRAHTALAAKLLEEREDPESAAQEYEKALELDPDYIPAHRGLQIAYGLIGKVDQAYHHLREVKRLKTARPDKDEDVEI